MEVGKNMTIKELIERVREFRDGLGWRMYHRPKDLAISIVIEASELLELFQWLDDEDVEQLLMETRYRTALSEEIADIFIYLLSMVDVLGLDLVAAVLSKLDRNKRKYRREEVGGERFKKWLMGRYIEDVGD